MLINTGDVACEIRPALAGGYTDYDIECYWCTLTSFLHKFCNKQMFTTVTSYLISKIVLKGIIGYPDYSLVIMIFE